MNDRLDAEEHLRVIRSLMERATVYRAISAPTAAFGGVMSLITAGVLLLVNNDRASDSLFSLTNPGAARRFMIVWCGVLLATLLANTFFIWRKARREMTPFMTSGLRLAIRSAVPVLIVAAVLTSLFWRGDETAEALPVLVVVWLTCYGLALLTTASFAPPSLRLLGWAFLVTGVVGILFNGPIFKGDSAQNATIAMAITFGLYHLVYGACAWPRKPEAA